MASVGRPKIPLVTPAIPEGIPSKEINFDQVLYWMDLGSPAEDIAGSFRVSVDTLTRRIKEKYGLNFAELKERTCGGAKIRLRHNQFKMSESNSSMAIWLGKQWLGQTDKMDKETKDFIQEQVYQAIKEINDEFSTKAKTDSGVPAACQPTVEDEQSLLDQRQRGKKSKVQDELGSGAALE